MDAQDVIVMYGDRPIQRRHAVGNVDWTAPIGYVDPLGRTFPARLLGKLKVRSGFPYLVVIDFGDFEQIRQVSEDGRSSTGICIRNIPEPKREPRVVWILEGEESRGLHYTVRLEEPQDKITGYVWRKFVEEIES